MNGKITQNMFGINLSFYDFDEKNSLWENWSKYCNQIESKGCDVKKWFDFFRTYCQEIQVFNPLFDEVNKSWMTKYKEKNSDKEITLSDDDIFLVNMFMKDNGLGAHGTGTNIFINVSKIESDKLLFATIIHEITHVFETIIAQEYLTLKDTDTLYYTLKVKTKNNTEILDKFVQCLAFPSIEKNGFDSEIFEIAACQLEYNQKDINDELLEYAMELRVVESLKKDSRVSESINNFSLSTALKIFKDVMLV